MAEGSQNTKQKIQGLLDTRINRGLEGQAAIQAFAVEALTCLLECELARLQKAETDWSDARLISREEGAKMVAGWIRDYGSESPFVKSQIAKLLGTEVPREGSEVV